jgi:hypothetical protein
VPKRDIVRRRFFFRATICLLPARRTGDYASKTSAKTRRRTIRVAHAGRRFDDYEQALQWFGKQVAETWKRDEIGETSTAAPSVDERLVQCIWHDGLLLGRPLATRRGKSLTIQSPGDWNHEAGPDFLRAEITLDGQRLKGDVEIHVDASGWKAHQHDRNFDYNGVVLHVYLEQDDDLDRDLLHNGRPLERLHLRPYLEPDIETLSQTIALDDYPMGEPQRRGRCHKVVESLDIDTLVEILDLAGRRRLEEKASRFAAQLSGESLDQVFYQALMTALGHKSGKALYFLLAKRAPIVELADHVTDCASNERARLIEAIFYHVGNLMPGGERTDPLDEPSLAYLDELNRHWSRVAGYFTDRIIPPTRRWYTGIRPVNFPCRRLAGVAHLLAQWLDRGVVDAALETLRGNAPASPDRKSVKRMVDGLSQQLSVQVEHYWRHRYVWGGKIAAHAQSLIGEGQTRSILFNALLPVALLWAREHSEGAQEAAVFGLWRNFPRLPENQVVRLMRERLFGDSERFGALLTTEHRNQALFQIFNDCCNNRMADCSQCTLVGGQSA